MAEKRQTTSDGSKIACSVLKRKDNSIQKDSEMASGLSLIKKRKLESSRNGEPGNPEVRTTLKGHRTLLCVETTFSTFKRIQLLHS